MGNYVIRIYIRTDQYVDQSTCRIRIHIRIRTCGRTNVYLHAFSNYYHAYCIPHIWTLSLSLVSTWMGHHLAVQ